MDNQNMVNPTTKSLQSSVCVSNILVGNFSCTVYCEDWDIKKEAINHPKEKLLRHVGLRTHDLEMTLARLDLLLNKAISNPWGRTIM